MGTTESGQCEDYGEKVTDGWESSTLARLDPCFGYGYSCCTETYGDLCYWKDTYNCNNCELDIGYGGCNACCDSYDNTPSPTKEPTDQPSAEPVGPSAEKWAMLHPDYEGGDGELLWNIYYGDYADDERFDEFRNDQLWDADVIRSILETDEKFAKYQQKTLAHQVMNGPSKHTSHSNYGWMLLVGAALVIMAAAGLWYKQKGADYKQVDSMETQSLIAGMKEKYTLH